MHDRSGLEITMVQLPALNTPQFDWALSRMRCKATPVAPIYQPELAAEAITYAADHPDRREYWLGASTVATLTANRLMPGLLDRYLARTAPRPLRTAPARSQSAAVAVPAPQGGQRGHAAVRGDGGVSALARP
ncbi:hypothetical protein [Lentzea albidocapillata]|uniref:hypothetical protein n=1 Tax=Lentzea albidocapillata TaxID=40571 RepID=UPI0004C43DBB